ncbi:MAG: tetratricopeptide repeat protein [Thermoanaerobaculia bacterium]|nr:tetratricopeptide repeat protein [Thermoanaerobaculia bacterium]
MFCQVCGAQNPDELEFCVRCQQKLLVLSGPHHDEAEGYDEGGAEEDFSFDEHLLERISVLEEALKRTAETVRQLLGALAKQERGILINQTGLATLRELLEEKRLLDREEWSRLWESKMEYQLLALEKRERFAGLKDRIRALFQGEKRDLFEQLLEEAEYALFAFDVRRALQALENAFRLDRRNYELAYFLGEVLFNDGEMDPALAYFERVLAVEPEHFEGLVYSGVILYERGEVAAAREVLQRAATLHPDSFLPNFSLGAVHAGQGKLTQAAVLLERAVEIEPVPQALYLLGSCYYEMGKLTLAIRQLQRAVRHDPAHEEAHHLLGLAYLNRGWKRKALDAFRRAERLNPKRMRYADMVRYLSGERDSPLPAIGREAGDKLKRAERELAGEHPDRALASYREALELDPDNPTLLMSYALACLQLDRSRETEAISRKVLALEPGEMLKATAYATLIEALRTEGRFREGNRIGRRLLDEVSTGYGRAIAYYEMARNLAEMEESLDEALDYARLSVESAPEELKPFPLAALGWVHFKRKEFDRAIELLAAASDLAPTAMTLTQLGLALLASGDDERARQVLAQARELGRDGSSIEQKMMECMRDSSRLLERVSRPTDE